MSEWVCELPIDGMASFVSGGVTIAVSERLVRCRDCEHFGLYESYCYRLGEYREFKVDPDGFCAWGKRREDA